MSRQSTSTASTEPHAFLAFAIVVCLCVETAASTGEVVDMLPGIVKPTESAELSPAVDGVLEAILVEEGQTVAADAVLAVVDRDLAEASLRQAEFEAQRTASVQLAKTRVGVAEKYLARIEQAHRKQAASGLELDEALGRVDEARASLTEAHEQLAAARNQLESARAQHAAHEVRSPIAGEVVRIQARRGEMVVRSEPVITVVDLAELQVDLYVPTGLLNQLRVGEPYTLAAEGPVARDIEATLIYVEPLVDAATDTFRCRFAIDNEYSGLPAGFAVRLREPEAKATSSEPVALVR